MPIYEFHCPDCNVLFSFFSRAVNTSKKPDCPGCGRKGLERQVSSFAMAGRSREAGEEGDKMPFDDPRIERAVAELASDAERIDENNPKQAADLMRKFSRMTGMEYGSGMEEAINRMEAGEDQEAVESELGGLMDGEDQFLLPGSKGGRPRGTRPAPGRDPKLYEL
jgi:putative FmdB family regulatory protein